MNVYIDDVTGCHFVNQSACNQDVNEHCQEANKDKAEIVRCLSQTIRNDVLSGNEPSVSLQCRNQVSFELLQRVSLPSTLVHV